MSFHRGDRLGPYEIVSPAGAGGMGEVYKARDSRLDRIVALKVIPAEFAQDVRMRVRLQREARAVSQLSHPHICTLYDVGQDEGTDYLVMEYVEGETLASRLDRGPIPLDVALRYGVEMAEALDKAHKLGIVHRDLKPGNVMITKSGAKLLDFGLAMTRTAGPPITGETPAGTLGYMAPEQMDHADVDERTDIFALGAVLYEMISGRRAVASDEPIEPVAVDRVVRACLAKEPDDRIQTAHDVALQLRWIVDAVPPGKGRQWNAVVIGLIALTAMIAYVSLRPHTAPRRIETIIPAPEGLTFYDTPVISPDGTLLVSRVQTEDSKWLLWLRPLDVANGSLLPGTEHGFNAFWSPDSRSIGFFADGKLKRLDLPGGVVRTLCTATGEGAGTWNRAGTIVFADNLRLYRIAAAGGEPARISDLWKTGMRYRYPIFLPDGRHFFVLAQASASAKARVFIGDLEGDTAEPFLNANSRTIYSNGHVLYWAQGSLLAQRFDAAKLRVEGEPVAVATSLVANSQYGFAACFTSAEGTLVLRHGDAVMPWRLTLVDRMGNPLRSVSDPGNFLRPRFSHDRQRVAVEVNDAEGKRADLWVYDIKRATSLRVTFGEGNEGGAVWSPDDSSIVYEAQNAKTNEISLMTTASTGTESERLLYPLTRAKGVMPTDWSHDGRFVMFSQTMLNSSTGSDLWIYAMREKRAFPYVATPSAQMQAQFSPDGRWVAYASAEAASGNGSADIYVQPFPATGAKWRISDGGGSSPRWRGDGRELFYVSADDHLIAVPVSTAETFTAGKPQPLFVAHARGGPPSFDVSDDGQRFIVNRTELARGQAITVIQNWTAGLPQ